MSSDQNILKSISIQKTTIPLYKVLWRVYGYLKPYWKQTAGAYLSLLAILGLSTFNSSAYSLDN